MTRTMGAFGSYQMVSTELPGVGQSAMMQAYTRSDAHGVRLSRQLGPRCGNGGASVWVRAGPKSYIIAAVMYRRRAVGRLNLASDDGCVGILRPTHTSRSPMG